MFSKPISTTMSKHQCLLGRKITKEKTFLCHEFWILVGNLIRKCRQSCFVMRSRRILWRLLAAPALGSSPPSPPARGLPGTARPPRDGASPRSEHCEGLPAAHQKAEPLRLSLTAFLILIHITFQIKSPITEQLLRSRWF